jgi:hypothetical protein
VSRACVVSLGAASNVRDSLSRVSPGLSNKPAIEKQAPPPLPHRELLRRPSACMTGTNRIQVVLFGMQNRTFVPIWPAMRRTPCSYFSVMLRPEPRQRRSFQPRSCLSVPCRLMPRRPAAREARRRRGHWWAAASGRCTCWRRRGEAMKPHRANRSLWSCWPRRIRTSACPGTGSVRVVCLGTGSVHATCPGTGSVHAADSLCAFGTRLIVSRHLPVCLLLAAGSFAWLAACSHQSADWSSVRSCYCASAGHSPIYTQSLLPRLDNCLCCLDTLNTPRRPPFHSWLLFSSWLAASSSFCCPGTLLTTSWDAPKTPRGPENPR